MKTLLKTPQKKSDVNNSVNTTQNFAFSLNKSFAIMSIIVATTLSCQFVTAQETPTVISKSVDSSIIVSGVITDEYGPLDSANVILKNTRIGTATTKKGAFKFPKPLKKGDILVVSYVGCETQEVTISETSRVINITMKAKEFEVILTSSGSEKPYRSNRK
ncbi:carboxypeptidase-like regulatory domain-containing protein [Aurantibacter sp.]|uniref:carboxypeptidase-like regulatory domain-containing protein n=1 Tax=Aurantibacter sp. TaxID=2807103 RepID=UPI0035C7F665